MRRHRRPSSPPAATLPDDDDLLREILLRLPPLPSSLPRASLVCRRWLRLLSDPRFLRRFRAFHHRQPPLLGFFVSDFGNPYFTPTLDPPNCIPSARLSLRLPRDERWVLLGCRHGLGLLLDLTRLEVTVWDPVTGDKRCVAFPPGFGNDGRKCVRNGALLCDNHYSGCHRSQPFKVVLLRSDDVLTDHDPHVFASLYDSEPGVWGDIISTSVTAPISLIKPSVLVGNSLCWLLQGYGKSGILEFDLERQRLAEIDTPAEANTRQFWILRIEESGLGLAISSDLSIRLWDRKTSSDGVATWMLQKTIELDTLLSLRSPMERSSTVILGYDEDGHAIFVWTTIGVFMIQLKSMHFRNLFEDILITTYYPYRSFYATGRSIGSGDIGAETLNT
ncbi:hypothetical protein ACP70R_009271 [Stipagrostis hirtigluma subsp. patula]